MKAIFVRIMQPAKLVLRTEAIAACALLDIMVRTVM